MSAVLSWSLARVNRCCPSCLVSSLDHCLSCRTARTGSSGGCQGSLLCMFSDIETSLVCRHEEEEGVTWCMRLRSWCGPASRRKLSCSRDPCFDVDLTIRALDFLLDQVLARRHLLQFHLHQACGRLRRERRQSAKVLFMWQDALALFMQYGFDVTPAEPTLGR